MIFVFGSEMEEVLHNEVVILVWRHEGGERPILRGSFLLLSLPSLSIFQWLLKEMLFLRALIVCLGKGSDLRMINTSKRSPLTCHYLYVLHPFQHRPPFPKRYFLQNLIIFFHLPDSLWNFLVTFSLLISFAVILLINAPNRPPPEKLTIAWEGGREQERQPEIPSLLIIPFWLKNLEPVLIMVSFPWNSFCGENGRRFWFIFGKARQEHQSEMDDRNQKSLKNPLVPF